MAMTPFWTDDSAAAKGALRGAACITGSLKVAEMAGMLGFDLVWIEVEHGGASFGDVEDLCRATEAGGAIPVVRVSNHGRENVLRALEAGGKIIVVPLVKNADEARDLVRNGKCPPLGSRGFNTRSRGLGYGLDGIAKIAETFDRANGETHLIAQIETREAVENLDAICAVDGISGVLVGPGDLSLAYGKPGAFGDPDFIALVCDVMRRTRAAGKHAGILVAPGPLLTACREAGCDFFFCAGDINDLGRAWREILSQV
jgi:4-hydroxy-2-oxoheptanedioate aldolase